MTSSQLAAAELALPGCVDLHNHGLGGDAHRGSSSSDPEPVVAVARIRTTSPAVTPRSACTIDPGEAVGSQTTRSGRSSTTSGSVIEPRSVETVIE